MILLLAFGLRAAAALWGQSFCYASQEDCLDAYRVACNYAVGEERAQYIGQPNFNQRSKLPGPLWAAFCANATRWGGPIHGVVWLIVLLNTAAVYLTYLLANRMVGAGAALWGALLMATSLAAVQFSVVVFNPVVMPFFGGCFFLALWQVTTTERSAAAFWLLFLPLLMLQFHMSGLMLIPVIALVLWLKPTRLHIPWFVVGALCGLALYLPYMRGELAHGWQNTIGMATGGRRGYSLGALKVFVAPVSFLVNIWDMRLTYQPGEIKQLGRAAVGSEKVLFALNAVSVLFAILVTLGAIASMRESLRGLWKAPRATFARSPGPFFILTSLAVPLLMSLLQGKLFHGRYCLVLLAPLFALAGVGVVRLLSFPQFRRMFLPILVLTISANVVLILTIYRYQGKCIEQGSVFLPSFDHLEMVYQLLKTQAGAGRLIGVDDREYGQLVDQNNPTGGYARQIAQYVQIREKQRRADSPTKGQIVYFRLLPAQRLAPDSSGVVFCKQGIALIDTRPQLPNQDTR